LFFSLFRLPGKGEKGQTNTINMLFDKLRRESVSTMRDITLQSFSRHLSMFGVAGEHTRLGVVYHLVQK
jgi:hypothetical protein